MAALDALIKRPPRRKVYPVHLDHERAQRRADMVEQAKTTIPLLLLGGNQAGVDKLHREIAALDSEAEAQIHLVAIGAKRLDDLVIEHPPTAADIKAAKRSGRPVPEFDPDGFLPLLLSEAIERVVLNGVDEGRLTPEQITELVDGDTWPGDQISDLIAIATGLNRSPTARAVGNV